MRLICPNCGAQYEVPEDVIPDDGRDVQCSNCGDTWFQPSAQMQAQADAAPEENSAPVQAAPSPAPEREPDPVPPAEPEPQPAPEPQPIPEPQPEPQPDPTPQEVPESEPDDPWPPTPEPEVQTAPFEAQQEEPSVVADSPANAADDGSDDDDEEDDAAEAPSHMAVPPPATAEAAPRRRLDPEVSRVLREEAMREEALRSGGEGLETQTELGLETPAEDETARRTREAQDRVARMQGQPSPPPDRPAPEVTSRRGLLPDIEEINTSGPGEAKAAPPPVDAERPAPRKSGFSRGFLLVILLMVAAILVYTNAPLIAERLPQADPYISGYVAWVDQWRLWLDTQAKALAAE